jgi:subtilisin family serine protease
MNFSLRATAAAVAACASAGGALAVAAAGTAAASDVPTPSQVDKVEQTVSDMEVPYQIPLGTAVGALTGKTSTARVTGTLPAAPVVAPAEDLQSGHALLPEKILPALNTTHHLPGVTGSLPMVTGDGRVHDGALGVLLPDSPLHAKAPQLSLGRPLTYDGPDRAARPSGSIGLDDVAPSLQPPRLNSAPGGEVSLDERTSDASLTRPVDQIRAGAEAALKQLGLGGL